MEWPIFTFILLAAGAVIAALSALFLSARAYAIAARCSGEVLTLERTERLTPSKLAELAELRESIARAESLLEKVNRRAIAAAKPRGDDGTFRLPTDPAALKAELRKRAGLRAGEPAPHK